MAGRAAQLFRDTDPAALLADFVYVAERMRRDVADGRRSVAEATDTLAAAWELVTRLLAPPPTSLPSPPTPTDPPSRYPFAC